MGHPSLTERWRVADVTRQVGEPPDVLAARAAGALGLPESDVRSWSIARRAIDARGGGPPRFVCVIEVEVPAGSVAADRSSPKIARAATPAVPLARAVRADAARPVIVGMGPCGLFAALRLAAAGLRPVLLERGKDVDARAKDVSRLMGKGLLDADSNVCYGEGGAGTWSDGKLYTRVGGPGVQWVLETIVAHGGPPEILVNARPHLGTDRLVSLLKAMRATLESAGAELRFGTRIDTVSVVDGRVRGVRLSDGEHVDATDVVLAPGHSARELYRRLAETGVAMAPKGFAVGFRVEHPQALIDEVQYGRWADSEELPPAYYELRSQAGGRGVYSFCMCPGGSVVPTPTTEGEVCVNGMSHAARSGRYANSAVVVQVEPSDYAPYAASDDEIDQLLAGARFQRVAEEEAYRQGGGAFVAPAQPLLEYLAGGVGGDVRRTTYRRGVAPGDLARCYPEGVTAALRGGVRGFERGFRGFLSQEAVLIGVETRTSAPVTILRDRETLESPSAAGLYPSGEGAGYGGGIVSAAIDGMRVADAILARLGALPDPFARNP
ncbi:MAG: FAD-dependent oxidoreductase [Myxococcales bacterium]|nr:FAD-dependent oxidoreductase [Myxococcales bacterium]MCB9531924.1 FAD-dependent oxidoreductase [Myxococcales bacterium]MCB9533892.1 FAD-dependent oxidoreductase [Myxococcales bacterium]